MMKHIIDIVQKIRPALLNRPKDKRIDEFLESIFKSYNTSLESVIDSNITCQLLEKVDFVEQRILDALREFYNGRLMGALIEIQRLYDAMRNDLHVISINKDDIWYRGRIKERRSGLYTKKDMFHIPNQQREKVSNQRFSFNGYPCLYLGKSIWDCWEELDEPHLDDVCFSAFKFSKDVYLLDLSMPIESLFDEYLSSDYSKLLVTFPLIIACSIRVNDENVNFKAEYIIPQLLMDNLLNHYKYDGYMFSSTKQNPSLDWDERYLRNVVLPVDGKFDKEGLCDNLKQTVMLTTPICYKYEFLKSNVSNMMFATKKDIEAIVSGMKIDTTEEDTYPKSLFGQMEDILKEKEYSYL